MSKFKESPAVDLASGGSFLLALLKTPQSSRRWSEACIDLHSFVFVSLHTKQGREAMLQRLFELWGREMDIRRMLPLLMFTPPLHYGFIWEKYPLGWIDVQKHVWRQMEFALFLKVEYSSDSPWCCSHLHLFCAYMLSVRVPAIGCFASVFFFFICLLYTQFHI